MNGSFLKRVFCKPTTRQNALLPSTRKESFFQRYLRSVEQLYKERDDVSKLRQLFSRIQRQIAVMQEIIVDLDNVNRDLRRRVKVLEGREAQCLDTLFKKDQEIESIKGSIYADTISS